MKIQNIINGEVVRSSQLLEEALNLSLNDNCMINTEYEFSEEVTLSADHVGYQLPMVMMGVKMARIDGHNLVDFIQRLAYTDACGKSAINLPNGVEDLVDLHKKMRGWTDKGWEIETDLTHMEAPDFVEWTEFKVTQEILREVRALRSNIKDQLKGKLPATVVEQLI